MTKIATRLTDFDVVILAGGNSRRMGGRDKLTLVRDGSTLLDIVLLGCAAAVPTPGRIVIVGPRRTLSATVPVSVLWTREKPAGTGPAAAITTGIAASDAATVVVLAGDSPYGPGAIPALLSTLADHSDVDVAALVDTEGLVQPLCAAYSRSALLRAKARLGDPAARPARALLTGLRVARVQDSGAWARDLDTPAEAIALGFA